MNTRTLNYGMVSGLSTNGSDTVQDNEKFIAASDGNTP